MALGPLSGNYTPSLADWQQLFQTLNTIQANTEGIMGALDDLRAAQTAERAKVDDLVSKQGESSAALQVLAANTATLIDLVTALKANTNLSAADQQLLTEVLNDVAADTQKLASAGSSEGAEKAQLSDLAQKAADAAGSTPPAPPSA